jgi:ParB family chromosome partitioning protein
MTVIIVSANRLSHSPTNVRRSSDPEADAQLDASIEANGVLQNLIVLPEKRKKGWYRVTGGGRRLSAINRLIARGVLAADYGVPVMILDDATNAIEVSLAENLLRLAMNPAEACRAFQDIIEIEKKKPADVAKRFGVTERFVLGRLRLANLAEPIFEALGSGEITLDVASAYAGVSDVARQASVFEHMHGTYYADNPSEIRRQLSSFCYRGNDPKALFVGRGTYVAAGGRVDQDLFTDAETESWIDPEILDHLAEEKMRAIAADIARRNGIGDVRVCTSRHIPWTETRELESLTGMPVALTEDEEARAAALEARIAEEEILTEAVGADEDDEQRLAALEAELEALRERPPVFSDDERKDAIAFMVLGEDGVARLAPSLYRAPEPGLDDAEGGDEETETIVPATTRSPQSQKLTLELAMMKTELLAAHVASAPGLAINLATFLMAEAATKPYSGYQLPSELRGPSAAPLVYEFDSGTPAKAALDTIEEGLDRSWTAFETIEQRYDAFCALDEAARAAWLAYLVARTLKSIPAGDVGASFLDHLGCECAIDVAAWWRPTARNYFDRLRKDAILDLFDEVGGAELRARYAGSKKHDLAASAEKLFAGDTIVEADVKARALAWLPDAMRFEVIANAHQPPAEIEPADEGAVAAQVNEASEKQAGEPGVGDAQPGIAPALDQAA